MPADCLAFPVRVSGKDQLIRIFQCGGYIFHPLAALIRHLPAHLKIIICLNRAILGRQIANMTIGSQNFIIAAQILIDGFRLCR